MVEVMEKTLYMGGIVHVTFFLPALRPQAGESELVLIAVSKMEGLAFIR